MTFEQKVARLIAAAAVAALIAGSMTGTLLVIDDEAWPGRGGMEAVFQISALFSAYAFPVAAPVGVALLWGLSPRMQRPPFANPAAHLGAGLLLGLLVHLAVDLVIGERIDSREDFIGGTLAGGVAGLLWWFSVQRHESRKLSNG